MNPDEINFKVDLRRAKVYWSYYKTIFYIASMSILAGVISVSLLHLAGSISFLVTIALIVMCYVIILTLFALMTFIVWRHENRHLDELMEFK